MSTKPGGKDFKENFAFIIAILVIGSFVIFFGYALIEKPTTDTAKDVTSLYGGYVAAVLVYFFGQKQAQNLTNQAVQASADRDKYKKAHETEKSSITQHEENVRSLIEEIENLKRRFDLD